MTLVADLPLDDTPLAEIAAKLRSVYGASEGSGGSALTVHAGPVERPLASGAAVATPALFLGLAAARVRIGPLLTATNDACLFCLSSWVDHNRPDPEVWRTLPPAEPRPVATFPWPPLLFALIESAGTAYVVENAPRTFVDIDPATLRVERHRYLRAPDCPACTPRPADGESFGRPLLAATRKLSPDNFRTGSVANAITELRSAYVDYRTGLVRHMYRDSTSNMLPMWGAETTVPGTSLTEVGYGRHAHVQRAEGVAILEALERFCSQAPRGRRAAVRGSYRGLRAAGAPVVDPEAFILYAAEQRTEPGYELVPFSPELEHDWIWAFSFEARGPVLVSQQLAFYDGRVTPPAERFVVETSNGCALGATLVEAAFHGLLEVIERDAYMTRWHTHGKPKRIDLSDASMPDVQRLHARAAAEGFELDAFAINLEVGVPAVLAMIVDPSDAAPVKSYCASGASPRAESAIFGALVEVCSSIGVYQQQFGKEHERARAMLADASLVHAMRDHVVLYSIPEALDRLAFLNRKQAAVSAASLFGAMEQRWKGPDLGAELAQLVNDVRNVAADVIVVDQSSNVLEPLSLHCVKVLAPGMHPVTFGHQYRRISERRLASARRFQAAAGEGSAHALNPHPHNFP